MELLILISACKGGSAKRITGSLVFSKEQSWADKMFTAVVPYFPYSKQAKMKNHRGAIVGKSKFYSWVQCAVLITVVANLIVMAGADSVITLDLHSSQMQGFFRAPVDNLSVESSLARWIKENIPYWKEAVIVSKNASGAKRVTSLADMLKINFALIHVDSRRVRSYSRSSSISSSTTASLADERVGRDRQSTVISLHHHSEEGIPTEARSGLA